MEINWYPTYVTETLTRDTAMYGTGIVHIMCDENGVTVTRIAPEDYYMEPETESEERDDLFEPSWFQLILIATLFSICLGALVFYL